MKRGLVIGKFMPVHNGHIALINFAAQHCQELIVSMSYATNDAIAVEKRLDWMTQLFADRRNIQIKTVIDDFDEPTLPLDERTKRWAHVILKAYGHIDVVVSSEDYGAPLARHLLAQHILYDKERIQHSISASLILQHPFRYWSFIPLVVRPYFVKKVCFYGPESTGKSTLAKRLAGIYMTEWVPEVARELISSNIFTLEDIERIGRAQTDRVKQMTRTANKLLICDTDVITTQIYSQHYLNHIPAALYEYEKEVQYDKYFLFDIDVAWVADGMRDLGNKRDHMVAVFKKELEQRGIQYTLVRGSYEDRERILRHHLDAMLID
jgi:HTH-type transcriptional repressor of NAD biosynthesis genes